MKVCGCTCQGVVVSQGAIVKVCQDQRWRYVGAHINTYGPVGGSGMIRC